MSADIECEVAVIGLGPVGATVAGLLGGLGIDVVAIDSSRSEYPHPRAAHIDHTGLRTLQQLGVLDALLPSMLPNEALELRGADHDVLVRIDADQSSVSGLPSSMYFYQPDLDRELVDNLARYPQVRVMRGHEAVGLDARPDCARISVKSDGGDEFTLSARWVIACDGAHSPTRRRLGIELDSLDFDENWLVVDLATTAATELPDHAIEVCDPARPFFAAALPGDRRRFEFMVLPDETAEEANSPEFIARQIEQWIPAGEYTIERAAVYQFHGLIASRWREGRVFLAGDAAHQMPPFLGQGMCSGMRDATNLAWKLDAVMGGRLPESILDSYEIERSPHVRHIMEASVKLGRMLCTLDEEEARQRDQRMLAEGLGRTGKYFKLPNLQHSALVGRGGGRLFIQPCTSPNAMLDDVIGPRFLLLARTGAALDDASVAWWRDAGAVVGVTSDFGDAEASLIQWLDAAKADVVVVRPDRYVMDIAPSAADVTAALVGRIGGE